MSAALEQAKGRATASFNTALRPRKNELNLLFLQEQAARLAPVKEEKEAWFYHLLLSDEPSPTPSLKKC